VSDILLKTVILQWKYDLSIEKFSEIPPKVNLYVPYTVLAEYSVLYSKTTGRHYD